MREPCNGCGFCCLTRTCPLRPKPPVMGEPCPELLWNSHERRFVCVLAAQHGATLHIGAGCGIPLNPSRFLMECIRKVE